MNPIKRARLQKNWTKLQLAEASGLNHHTVAACERDEGVADLTLWRLATALDLPAERIVEELGRGNGSRGHKVTTVS